MAWLLLKKPTDTAVVYNEDEFAGPFTGWFNIKSDGGATGDGVTDDSEAFQDAIDLIEAGSNGYQSTIYVPAGTYCVNSLVSQALRGLCIVGEDPTTTILKYNGSAGGYMLDLQGVAFGQISRLTLDGQSSARELVYLWRASGIGGNYPTQNGMYDCILKDAEFGVRLGKTSEMAAEQVFFRSRFYRFSKAAVSIQDYNSLDIWAFRCYFEGSAHGMSTYYNDSGAAGEGRGQFRVYQSIFNGQTVADCSTFNLNQYSVIECISVNSDAFVRMFWPYGGSDQLVLRGNQVRTAGIPVRCSSQVAMLLTDNVLQNAGGGVCVQLSNSGTRGDVLSVGNTYSHASPITNAAASGRTKSLDDTNGSSPTVTLPGPYDFAPKVTRTVYEVAAGSSLTAAQTAVDSAHADAARSYVHLRYGQHNWAASLNVPANTDITIIGDDAYGVAERGTIVKWAGASGGNVIDVALPSKVRLKSFGVMSKTTNAADVGINISGSVAAGGAVSLEHCSLLEAYESDACLHVKDTGSLVVQSLSSNMSDARVGAATIVDNAAYLSWGTPTSNLLTGHRVLNGGQSLLVDTWYESAVSGATQGPYKFDGTNGDLSFIGGHYAPYKALGIDVANHVGELVFGWIEQSANPLESSIEVAGTDSTVPSFMGMKHMTTVSDPYTISGSTGIMEYQNATHNVGGDSQTIIANSGGTDQKIRDALAMFRETNMYAVASQAAGVSDIRLSRIGVLQAGVAAIKVVGT